MKIDADERGIIVTVRLKGGDPLTPARHSQALRRRAANRNRGREQLPPLPPVLAGDCAACRGWGVVGRQRGRCSACGGSGTRAS
jgi:hypothetical protein